MSVEDSRSPNPSSLIISGGIGSRSATPDNTNAPQQQQQRHQLSDTKVRKRGSTLDEVLAGEGFHQQNHLRRVEDMNSADVLPGKNGFTGGVGIMGEGLEASDTIVKQ